MSTTQSQEPSSVGSDNGSNGSEAARHLGRVIDESLFSMHFQPIVDLRSQSVFAYEALCRPQGEYFKSPVELISTAVEEARIGELGRLLRVAALQGGADSVLFLNLEPHEFDEPWLVRPDDPIFKHRHHVYLEITENVPLKYFDQCHSVLAELRKKGTSLVIDDFGAGFSNLKYIAELEPDIVKLDRDLIRDCKVGTSGFRLIKSITDLCHQMNAKVVAEGIETVDELDAVVSSGVDFGQGYLLARPAAEPPDIKWPQDAAPIAKEPPIDQPLVAETEDKQQISSSTADREFALHAEITELNDLLVESEMARLALARRMKEQSGTTKDSVSDGDSAPSEAPTFAQPTSDKSTALSRFPRLALVIPWVLASILAGWVFWPSSEGSHDEIADAAVPVENLPDPVTEVTDPSATASTSLLEQLRGPEASAESNTGVTAETPDEDLASPDVPTRQTADPPFSIESAPASSEAPATDPEPAPAAMASKIASRISGWADAWSQQRVEEYLSFYSPEFQPASGQAFRAWSRVRRQRIAAPASINVSVSHLDFTFPQPRRALASFHQIYSSPGYRDEVRKTLEWALEDGQWHILSESSEPLP